MWQLEKVFDAGFSVCWDGEWCGVFLAEEQNLLELHTAEDEFAEAHNMEKIERGAYITAKSADDFKEYRMWIEDERTGKETYTMLSYDEFKYYWRVLEAELIPPRPPYNND